jgi:putative nucleotidyltransferase with HDIG domain
MSATRSIGTRVYIAAMLIAALCFFSRAIVHWESSDPLRFLCYLVAAMLASPLKVGLPDIEGTLSVNFLFTLIGILEMSLSETLLIALVSTFAQFYWKPLRRLKSIQLLFNLSQVTVCSGTAFSIYHFISTHVLHGPGSLALLIAAIAYFGCNTAAMSTIISLTEAKSTSAVWRESYLWSFPYYMVGAAVAGLVGYLDAHIGWQASLLALPAIYLMYRSYHLYLGKLEAEKLHAQKVSDIHLRTIEALALAIDAKDETTGEHMQRVRVYAVEVARELGLEDDEIEALRAAAVLHDIGKLAVPDYIISKPGKLTSEEFEKMTIHPIVGAEILDRVNFPYPVVPIVRAHHEKWDGTGYPNGLQGENIPIGARILAAVDYLDALASDRQYRRALPLSEAMAKLASQAGKSFDPRIVEILSRRYQELEKLARSEPLQAPMKLSTDSKIIAGTAPDAGLSYAHRLHGQGAELLVAAEREAQVICEFRRKLGTSLTLQDVFSLLGLRIRQFVPYDSITFYTLHDKNLVSQFVGGENFRLFCSLNIPLGRGLVGWVAQNSKSILNGNPSVEFGYLENAATDKALRSGLAVPLEGKFGVVGVLALYRFEEDAFSGGELNLVRVMSYGLGAIVEDSSQSASPKIAHKATSSSL